MIRGYFHKFKKLNKDKIAWRSHEVTRIEAFSDAVFAFAVSLLVISLEVPKNSKELIESLKGLIPFIFCFIIIFWIWRAQYKFFRRYGLHDSATLALNGVLLFMTLAFVYPLKFLFNSVFLPETYKIIGADYATLVILYNSGFMVIGFLFSLMYFNAFLKKDAIRLTPIETFETVSKVWNFFLPAFVSMLAMIAAYVLRNGDKVHFSYLVYALLGILMPLLDSVRNKVFKKKFGKVPVVELEHNPEG